MSSLLINMGLCLLAAGVVGLVAGWLLRGGCHERIDENNELWERRLTNSGDEWENKLRVREENHFKQLENRDREYKESLQSSLLSNNRSKSSENELISLRHKLSEMEEERMKSDKDWRLVLDDIEQGLKSKLGRNESLHKETKEALEKSLIALNQCKNNNNLKNSEIAKMEKKLHRKDEEWNQKLQTVELRWVDKVEVCDSESNTIYEELKRVKKKYDKAEVAAEYAKSELKSSRKKWDEKIKKYELKSEKVVLKSQKNIAPLDVTYFASTSSDDLKRIKGIGAGIEKKLNEFGITTFAQIALWTEEDVETINQILSFKGRIERELWREQAKELMV